MYEKDLKFKVNVEDVEKESHASIKKNRPDWIETELDRPFGACHEDWEKFKKTISENDELWYFDTDEASWASLAGRSGYAIVRSGKVLRVFCTELS